MSKGILRVGIVGNGQLGRMMIEEAAKLGLDFYTLGPGEKCPTSGIATYHIVSKDFSDTGAFTRLAQILGSPSEAAITHELEHWSVEEGQRLEDLGFDVHPNLISLYNIQNKLRQKQILAKHGVRVAAFEEMRDIRDVLEWIEVHGSTAMLKATNTSYDGYGNSLIKPGMSREHIESEFERLLNRSSTAKGGVYAEEVINFTKEISVNVANSLNGDRAFYPVAENDHKRNVLFSTIAPARISPQTVEAAQLLAGQTIDALSVLPAAGNYCVEMFVLPDGTLVVNEVAPRPHNSGHFTMEGCKTSQFENHIRGVVGLPLGSTEMVDESALMWNILGEPDQSGKVSFTGVESAMKAGFAFHNYGKSSTKPWRKMGHMTATGSLGEMLSLNARRDGLIIRATAEPTP